MTAKDVIQPRLRLFEKIEIDLHSIDSMILAI